jgi:uncharacterized protein (TIGR03086 family)
MGSHQHQMHDDHLGRTVRWVGHDSAMTENPLVKFDRAAAVADSVIAAVRPDQLGDPTPCTEWSVRQLINHLVTGNLMFAGMVTGGPRPDRNQDQLGDDPLGAFRSTASDLRAAFSAEGALDGTYPTPFGESPGAVLVNMRVVEMSVHSWDIAKATGQSTDLDPQLAEWGLRSLRNALPADRAGSPFGTEQPASGAVTAADRLAAFAGRAVQ